MQRKTLLLIIFLSWLFGGLIYGWIDVSDTMNDLRMNPSPDLYANNFGFQLIAFMLTKGMAALFILGIGLVAGLFYTGKRQP
ncbi:hypothetical protein ACEN9F_27180 [Duganella sp. CT11-25]|uniref:hypothetical protein n=1 Tax=unclassified Duganella TaxID=2636909 RepID=UPI0039AED7A1